jgi:predicted lipoprotein with Yx(FWY)xxD motif
MNEIDRRERAGRVAARESANRIVVMLTLTAMLGVVALLVTGSLARSATQANGTVSLSKTKLGEVLVNSKGLTLYMFSRDKNGKSSCSGSCAKFWPPYLLHGKATAGSGVKASLLGTTRRSNGSMQVTYKKHPLYGFALDKKAGETNGEGNVAFGGKWHAVSAKGTAVVKAPTPSTTTPTTPTPYPYP